MPARTKDARLRRTLTVSSIEGEQVRFSLSRSWQPRQLFYGGRMRNVQVTAAHVEAGGGGSSSLLALGQSERASAKVDGSGGWVVGAVLQSGEWRPPFNTPGATARYDEATAKRVVDFINEFHLRHISGEVQRARAQRDIEKRGTQRTLGRVALFYITPYFPFPESADSEAEVFDFPESGADEVLFRWGYGGGKPPRYTEEAVVARSELRDASRAFMLPVGPTQELEQLQLVRAETVGLTADSTGVNRRSGWYARLRDLNALAPAQAVASADSFPMRITVESVRLPGTPDGSAVPALVEYVGRSRSEGARLRLTVGDEKPFTSQLHYIKFQTSQKELMSPQEGFVYLSTDSSWAAHRVRLNSEVVGRILVALDQRMEAGLAGAGNLGAAPQRTLQVRDIDGQLWDVNLRRTGRGLSQVGYRRERDGSWSWYYVDNAEVRKVYVSRFDPTLRGYIVLSYAPNHEYAGVYYPVLPREEAERLLPIVQAFVEYYVSGAARTERVEAKERALGLRVRVGTLPTWRNPVDADASTRPPNETLEVDAYPESGADTLRLGREGFSGRDPEFSSINTLTTRYATGIATLTREKLPQTGGNHLILVYAFGMDTYPTSGIEGSKRAGLYARQSDVYDIVWKAWSLQQQGWSRPEAGPRAMPNFPFDVQVEHTPSKQRVAARVEYIRGRNQPRFVVTVNPARVPGNYGNPRNRSLWVENGAPAKFEIDLSTLQKSNVLDPVGGFALPEEDRQRILIALDARYEAGLRGLGTAEYTIAGLGDGPLTRVQAFDMFRDTARKMWRNFDRFESRLTLSEEPPNIEGGKKTQEAGATLTALGGMPKAVGNMLIHMPEKYILRISDEVLQRAPADVYRVMTHEAGHIGYMNHGRDFRELVRQHGGVLSLSGLEQEGISVEVRVEGRDRRYRSAATGFATEAEAVAWVRREQVRLAKEENVRARFRLNLGDSSAELGRGGDEALLVAAATLPGVPGVLFAGEQERTSLDGVISIPTGKPPRKTLRYPHNWYTTPQMTTLDFSHLLPEDVRAGHALVVQVEPKGTYADVRVFLFSRKARNVLGAARGQVGKEGSEWEGDLVVEQTWVDSSLQNRGVGRALYEALYRTGFEEGATHVRGGAHSTMARRLHQSLAKRHGWEYEAEPNTTEYGGMWDPKAWEQEPERGGANDERWQSYSFPLTGLGTWESARAESKLLITDKQLRTAQREKATAIIWMKPQDFLALSTTHEEPDWSRSVQGRPVKALDAYNRFIESGEVVLPPYLDVDIASGVVLGHEGRHRAAAVMNAGGTRFPVAIFLKENRRTIYYREEESPPWRKTFLTHRDIPKVLHPEVFYRPGNVGWTMNRTQPVVLDFTDAVDLHRGEE